MSMQDKFVRLHTLVNDAFAKVGQAIWGPGYLLRVYEDAVDYETDGHDVDAKEVECVHISDKVDFVDYSSVDWN